MILLWYDIIMIWLCYGNYDIVLIYCDLNYDMILLWYDITMILYYYEMT